MSIEHAISVIHDALFSRDDLLIDNRTRRSTLAERRRKIETRYTAHCSLPDFEEEEEDE